MKQNIYSSKIMCIFAHKAVTIFGLETFCQRKPHFLNLEKTRSHVKKEKQIRGENIQGNHENVWERIIQSLQ